MGQWEKKFSYPNQKILRVANGLHGELNVYDDEGNVNRFNGLRLTNDVYSQLKVLKIKDINGEPWVLSNTNIFLLNSSEKDEFSKYPNEIIDFVKYKEDWIFITEFEVLEKFDFELLPMNLYDSHVGEAYIGIESIKGNVFIIKEKSISLLENNRIAQIDTVQDNIINYKVKDELFYLATQSGIYLFDGKVIKPFLLHDPTHSPEIKGLHLLDNQIWYEVEGELVNLKDFKKIKIKNQSSLYHTDEWQNSWSFKDGQAYVYPSKTLQKPMLFLEELILNAEKIADFQKIKITDDKHEINFVLDAVQLIDGQSLTYSYLLEPGDKSWSSDIAHNAREYKNLQNGKYVFNARAKVNGGDYVYLKPIRFTVARAMEQQYFKWIAAILALLLGIAIYFQNREKKKRALLELSQKTLKAENTLFKEREKVLQLQMNPHFLFNALNSINGMIALEEKSKARKYLKIFSHLMRQVLEQNANEKISINEEVKYLENYLSLEKMMCNEGFEYEINIDESVDKDKMQIKPMLIQPFLENAIIHGVKKGKLPKGKISLNIKKVGNGFDIIIEDNGEGLKIKSSEPHNSMAMEIVKQRLGNKDSLHVVDKKEEGSNGVKVNLKLN